jgi:pimeloyl-ACP methyl ester carboxylesterase
MKTGLVNPVRRSLLVGAGVAAAISSLGGTSAIAGTSGAARLFFTEAGAGKNVLLLHGWTADSTDWLWQLPAFERQYRVVAVDLRGHGRSEIMPSGMYAPDDYLADVESLIATRYPGERFVVIGHSMGAQIAARLAAKRPDLISAVVSIDGSLGFPAEMEPAFSKTAADLQRGDPRSAAAGLFELVYDPATDPAYRRWHARRLMGMPEHVVRESFGPLFQGAEQVGIGARSEAFCRTLKTPIYHLCRDPVQASRMAPWFSHRQSKVDYWAGAGHWIMQDRSAPATAAVVGWIDALN